jgi:putative transposase
VFNKMGGGAYLEQNFNKAYYRFSISRCDDYFYILLICPKPPMHYDPSRHKRQSLRLKGYDYSQAGLYFITICVQNRDLLFGEIVNGEMQLNGAGKMVQSEWEKIPQRSGNVDLHEFIVMPNHFHGVLQIVGAPLVGALAEGLTTQDIEPNDPIIPDNVDSQIEPSSIDDAGRQGIGAPTRGAPTGAILGDIIGVFKSLTTVGYIKGIKNLNWEPFDGKLWQRNFYEHIIRDERAYENISHYIRCNAANWRDDKFYKA